MALDDVKEVKNALGVTVNDVILAICAGALRTYLEEHQELPEDPLVATVPVSVHPDASHHRGANKISAMFVSLPCATSDPVERVESHGRARRGPRASTTPWERTC